MKKILAVLVVLAMALSVSVAFAAPVSCVNIAKDSVESYFQFATTIPVAIGQEIKIVLQSEDGAILDTSSIRTGDKSTYNKETVTLTDLGNGWYELSATATKDGVVLVRLYFGEVTDKTTAEVSVNVAEISVAGTSYKFASDADVEAAGIQNWSGMTPICTIVEKEMAEVSTEDTTETEDATETEDTTVEETGVVSVAVAAVVAVIGGAVVLKKREF